VRESAPLTYMALVGVGPAVPVLFDPFPPPGKTVTVTVTGVQVGATDEELEVVIQRASRLLAAAAPTRAAAMVKKRILIIWW